DRGVVDWHAFGWIVTGVNGTVLATGDKQAFSYTPLNDGIYTVTFKVTDDSGDSNSDALTLTVKNAPPVVQVGADQTTTEGSVVSDRTRAVTGRGRVDTPR